MVESRSMNKCVILFALIACHAILSTEGRQLKYEKEETAEPGSKSINYQQNAAGINMPRAANTVSVAAGKKEIFPPSSFDDSATVYEGDFRPTTPGNSPGVVKGDHRHDGGHSVTGYKDEYPKTASGQSPGVGHLLSNKSAEPKA